MIQDKLLDLEKEFRAYMEFWMLHMLNADHPYIYPEISNDLVPNKMADMGSMYLSRIIYGATKGGERLQTDNYDPLGLTALKMLQELKNPSGGYYWSRKYNMEWVHNPNNVNMSQAFVLYGLTDYAKLNNSEELEHLIQEQLDFIEVTLKDDAGAFYLDGFDQQWHRGSTMTRSFGTHFHLMEAFVKVYELGREEETIESIRSLLQVILDRFIDKKDFSCLHRYTENWELLPNENWAGHNAECSWVMCHAAKIINDKELIDKTEAMSVSMMNKVIELNTDKVHGGYSNSISESGAMDKDRSWWQQLEIAIGLWNVYEITGDKNYQVLAVEQVTYIKTNFLSENGEWYAAINLKGEPLEDTPQVFFWKSMYHTVRYYDYFLARF